MVNLNDRILIEDADRWKLTFPISRNAEQEANATFPA